MAVRLRRAAPVRAVLDLNTQCDFLLSRGALPVANRTEILPAIRRLMDWARRQRVPVISSLDSHRAGEPVNGVPRHCVENTHGQQKLPFTLLPRRITLHNDNTLDVPFDIFSRHRQVILPKWSKDFLNNLKADRLVCDLPVRYFIVFGLVAELCVKSVVLGLIARNRRVVLVTDALGCWNVGDADLAIRQMEAKGAMLSTSDEIVGGRAFEFPHDELDENSRWEPALSGGLIVSQEVA